MVVFVIFNLVGFFLDLGGKVLLLSSVLFCTYFPQNILSPPEIRETIMVFKGLQNFFHY